MSTDKPRSWMAAWGSITAWRRPELRVLFVCTANVCRSPLAEAMLRHRLQSLGLARRVQVRSAGSRVGQIGRAPDPRIKKLAEQSGISLGRIRARKLTATMVRDSDYTLVMERRHLDDLSKLLGDGDSPGEIGLLGNYLHAEDSDQEIADPYYGNWQGFEEVSRQIKVALDSLVKDIEVRLAG